MSAEKKSFEQLLGILTPVVFEHVNEKASVACVREMVEDIAYMIQHGYTVEMCNHKEKRGV